MVLTDAGEDDILYCNTCSYCANVEVSAQQEGEGCTRCGNGKLSRAKASEVGNIFDLGTKYPKDFDFTFKTKEGADAHPIMGCFGIGITRLMGVIVEALSDEKGIVWPSSVAPFQYHIICLAPDVAEVKQAADDLYAALINKRTSVLYDDRTGLTAGEKFNDSDLIGIPVRIVVSKKTIEAGKFEIKQRASGEVSAATTDEILATIS
jgi:prolyl-tRNA synthetase